MRLPLILIASACLFTSCQRPSAVETGCREAIDNFYYALGNDKHKIVDFHMGDEQQSGLVTMRVVQSKVDLMGNGETVDGLWHCDYSDGKHFYAFEPN